jgi:enoyl-CoA hydratase
MGLELMGSRTLQRFAAETDAKAHQADATKEYFEAVKEVGLSQAFRERDARFGDSRIRVRQPETRDEHGRFID